MPTPAQPAPLLPDRLQEARRRALLSQDDLAAQAEVSRKTVGNYEAGKTQPDLPTLRRLASVVKVSPEWLTGTSTDDDEADTIATVDVDRVHRLDAPVVGRAVVWRLLNPNGSVQIEAEIVIRAAPAYEHGQSLTT